jgi:hypothetical protein
LKKQRCLQDELELEMRRLELRNEALRLEVRKEELKQNTESHVESGVKILHEFY